MFTFQCIVRNTEIRIVRNSEIEINKRYLRREFSIQWGNVVFTFCYLVKQVKDIQGRQFIQKSSNCTFYSCKAISVFWQEVVQAANSKRYLLNVNILIEGNLRKNKVYLKLKEQCKVYLHRKWMNGIKSLPGVFTSSKVESWYLSKKVLIYCNQD